jgi:hypothetical protein
MSPRHDEPEFEDWGDEADEPQERDLVDEDEDETPTVPCPSCRRPVPDFADKCPYCGDWIVQSSGEPARRNAWFVVLVVLVVLTFVAWYVF